MSQITLPFRPLPLLGNPHLQTILANLLPRPELSWPTTLRVVPLPDGDQLAVQDTLPSNWENGKPAVLMVHGLGGCHHSPYLVRLARLLAPRGVRVLRIDLRGAGAGVGLARKTYNAACSHDVRAVAAWLHRQSPASPLALFGMSLGGSIVLKLAGEAADEPVPGLAMVAAVSAPLDLVLCSKLIDRMPWYNRYYVHHMTRQIRKNQRHFPDMPRIVFPRGLTLRGLDEMHTAPQGGFESAVDYYQKASSLPLIPRIGVPTLLMTARDDPFIAAEDYDHLPPNPRLDICIADRGGHLGFLGWDGNGGIRWSERQVANWLCRHLGAP